VGGAASEKAAAAAAWTIAGVGVGEGAAGTSDGHTSETQAEARTVGTAAATEVGEVGWSSGGAAGAAINALTSRMIFDMQRSPDKIAEMTWILGKLVQSIPDLPKFVGPIAVDRVCLGKSVPQVLAARIPNAAAASAAPWDGGVLANRGPCSALELEVEFGGVAEITLVTHIDLSVYAEMMREDGAGLDSGGAGAGGAGRGGEGSSSAGSGSGGSGRGRGGGGSDGHESPKINGHSESAAAKLNSQMRLLSDKFKVLAKNNASKLIGAVAKKLVGVPIFMTLKVKRLSGTMRVWVPPPPGDRLWWGFVDQPQIEMEAIPMMGHLGIRWHGLAEKVSKVITSKLLKEFTATLVLPNAANSIIEPLAPFNAIPEIQVSELLAMTRNSFVSEETAHEADASPETLEATKSRPTPTPTLTPTRSSVPEVAEIEGDVSQPKAPLRNMVDMPLELPKSWVDEGHGVDANRREAFRVRDESSDGDNSTTPTPAAAATAAAAAAAAGTAAAAATTTEHSPSTASRTTFHTPRNSMVAEDVGDMVFDRDAIPAVAAAAAAAMAMAAAAAAAMHPTPLTSFDPLTGDESLHDGEQDEAEEAVAAMALAFAGSVADAAAADANDPEIDAYFSRSGRSGGGGSGDGGETGHTIDGLPDTLNHHPHPLTLIP
jgi:hypothetical protein